MSDGTYESIQQHRAALGELAAREAAIVSALKVPTHIELVDALRARIVSDTFTILVLGDFKNGKSTFINALLGEKVLPSFARPATAIVNEVRYAADRSALVHALPVDGARTDPVTIPIGELERHVTIDARNPDRPSPYERAEVFWPLELCRNGVVLVDSPGLNEDPIRSGVTLDYLRRADAVILVLNAEKILAENERSFIELHLHPMGYDNVFYVANKINLVDEECRDDLIEFARHRARPYLEHEDRLFFVDARGGLEARRADDAQRWTESGIAAVEAYLERFLVESKGRAKILGPARELRSAMNQIRRDIRERESLLAVDLDDLRRRYTAAQEPLSRLERRRDEIVRSIENHHWATRQEAVQAVRRRLEQIADGVPEWIDEVETEARLTMNPLNATAARQAFVEELSRAISHRTRRELAEWLGDDLQKHLLARSEDLEHNIGHDLTDFERRVDEIRFELGGIDPADTGPVPSDGQRLAAAITGLVMVDAGSAYTGSMYGFKEMAKTAVPRLAVLFAGVALAVNPFVLVGVLLGSTVVEGLVRKGGAERRIRATLAARTRDGLRDRAADDAETVGDQIAQQLRATRDAVLVVLSNEIDDVRTQVEVALAEKEAGEARVVHARAELVRHSQELDEISDGLDEIIYAVAR
jgi:GTPase SAR1 family protein